MKKFLIKGIVVIFFVILLIGMCFKVYHYVIIHNVYQAIENFISEKNRYYSVVTIQNGKMLFNEQIFCKDNQIKYLVLNSDLKTWYFELKNFDEIEKALDKSDSRIQNSEFLTNIPISLLEIYQNNKFNFDQFFQIYHITSTEYEGKRCYKIVTKIETLLVDKSSYLPLYAYRNLKSSEKSANPNKEYIYEFEVNTVKNTDMQES